MSKKTLSADRDRLRLGQLVSQAVLIQADGVHFDVEPHLVDDWTSRQDEYRREYVEALTYARQAAAEAGLSVSATIAPAHGDRFVEDVLAVCDWGVLMAYGRTAAVLQAWSSDDSPQAAGKLHVAIRPGDFVSFEELERVADSLSANTAAGKVVVQDLRAMIDDRGFSSQALIRPREAPRARSFTIVVASETSRERARRRAASYSENGQPAEVIPAVVDGRRYYRIALGAYPTREAASRAYSTGVGNAEISGDAWILEMEPGPDDEIEGGGRNPGNPKPDGTGDE